MKIQRKLQICSVVALSVLSVALGIVDAQAQDKNIQMPPSFDKMPMKIGIEAFLWRVHLEPGAKYQARLFTRTMSEQNVRANKKIPAERVAVAVTQNMRLDYDVLSTDRFGAATMRVTYRDVVMDVTTTVNGHQIAGPVQKAIAYKLNQYLANVYKDQSFNIKSAPDGQIWNIVGLSALRSRLEKSINQLSPQEHMQFKKMFFSLLDEQQLKKTLGQVKGALPAQPVRVGESWTYDLPTWKYGPITVTMNGKRTLAKLVDKEAYIKENIALTVASDKFDMGEGSFKIKDFQGVMTGGSKVDVATGLIEETNLKTHYTMQIEIDYRGEKTSIPSETEAQVRMVVEPR